MMETPEWLEGLVTGETEHGAFLCRHGRQLVVCAECAPLAEQRRAEYDERYPGRGAKAVPVDWPGVVMPEPPTVGEVFETKPVLVRIGSQEHEGVLVEHVLAMRVQLRDSARTEVLVEASAVREL